MGCFMFIKHIQFKTCAIIVPLIITIINMDNTKALEILIQAVQVAQQKGAFNLQEAKLIAEAVEVFIKKPEVKEESKDATDSKQ